MAQVKTWFTKYCWTCGQIFSEDNNADEMSIVLSD
jgi:hypothetical protein